MRIIGELEKTEIHRDLSSKARAGTATADQLALLGELNHHQLATIQTLDPEVASAGQSLKQQGGIYSKLSNVRIAAEIVRHREAMQSLGYDWMCWTGDLD